MQSRVQYYICAVFLCLQRAHCLYVWLCFIVPPYVSVCLYVCRQLDCTFVFLFYYICVCVCISVVVLSCLACRRLTMISLQIAWLYVCELCLSVYYIYVYVCVWFSVCLQRAGLYVYLSVLLYLSISLDSSVVWLGYG